MAIYGFCILFEAEDVRYAFTFKESSTSKLFACLDRDYQSKCKGPLNDINQSRNICETYGTGRLHFAKRLPDNGIFNKRIAVDLTYLDGTSMHQRADAEKNFTATHFISKVNTVEIWETSVILRINMYNRYPSHIHIVVGSVLNSIEWTRLCREATV